LRGFVFLVHRIPNAIQYQASLIGAQRQSLLHQLSKSEENMNKIFWFFIVILLAGCSGNMPISAAGGPNEYVVVRRHLAGPFSSLAIAKREAREDATEHCKKMGMAFAEKYSIDRPIDFAQVPETTLFFTCVTPVNK
jgi:hypothetical protein